MIEIVYKEEKKEAKGNEAIFQLPRNIRQIGEGKSYLKIYMEDYVYTYLQKLAREEPVKGRGSILLGKYNWDSGVSYLFIQSALYVEEMEPAREHITLDEEVWRKIGSQIETFFPGQEIVGWSLFLPENGQEISDTILHTHLDHFGGNDKVFFFYQPQEKEESFYTYENGQMAPQGGYYIYYEKNEPMQSYMIEQNRNRSIEEELTVPDRAVSHFRQTITEKTEQKQHVQVRKLVYGTSACLAVTALALGITFMNHYDGMKKTVDTVLEGEMEEKSQEANGQAKGEKKEETVELSEEEKIAEPTAVPEIQKEEGEILENPKETEKPSVSEPAEIPEKSSETEKASAAGKTFYTVKKGDTLSQISAAHYGTVSMVSRICQVNSITPEDIIYEGQKLELP